MSKTLITGNPSSGTTFTVGLLTRLGYDTGFTEEEIEGNYAGLEIMAGRKEKRQYRRAQWKEGNDISPHVIKHPFDRYEPVPKLLTWVDQLGWEVERVILLVRNNEDIEQNRKGFNPAPHDRQLAVLLLEAAEREWPVQLLAFPRAALDAEYCWRGLQPLTIEDFKEFREIHSRHVKEKEIHTIWSK